MPQWLRARAAPRLLPSLVWLILAFGAVTYTLEVFFSMGHLTWVLCAVSFVLNGVSLILHLVHGALKRRLAVDRVIVCVNVASLSAAALMREHLRSSEGALRSSAMKAPSVVPHVPPPISAAEICSGSRSSPI